jgi:feruloyl esterase
MRRIIQLALLSCLAGSCWARIEAQEPAHPAADAACESLDDVRLPNTTITAAQTNTAGSFTPPGANAITGIPPFCRVTGEIQPTKDSHILFELWLPLQNWNGKFAGVGNGGWAGRQPFGALAKQVQRGYATASTNTGHQAMPGFDMARFAFGHPEQLIDFAYRAYHETTVKAKQLTQTFYGKAPEHSYFIGCSSGGCEGLMEAQRFPADYDGIVAGAPANNWTRLMAGDLDAILAVARDSATNLPASALDLLSRAALASCDAADGVTDGVLEDPRRCAFDPAMLQCSSMQSSSASCLTPPQVEAARRVYRGLKDPKTGAQLYPGLAPGSEPFWPKRDPANPFAIPIAHYRWLVFADSSWDWRTFDFTKPADHQAFLRSESRLAPILNATNPDLRDFRRRGGKLLQYHGWSDPLIAPQNSIDYYQSVVSFFAAGRHRSGARRDVQNFYRLYMVPGMAHCGGGPGPNASDMQTAMQTALEKWVEQGTPPEAVVTTHSLNGVVDRSRRLCPYPKVAVYKGESDTNDAANFACRDR